MPEERIARLESDVKHIDATLTDMKLDIREIRSGLESLDTRLSNRMDNLDTRMQNMDNRIENMDNRLSADIKGLDGRLIRVEMTIKSAITSFKATVAVLTLAFGIVVYVFGTYATKILDAVNGLVLK